MSTVHELRSEKLLVRATSSPHIRISHLSLPDSPNLLLENQDSPYVGIRTAVMEPHQTEYSFSPCNQPAESVESSAEHIKLTGRVDPHSALSISLSISFEGDFLLIEHQVKNHGPKTRRVALWPIMVVPKEGIGFSPFGRTVPHEGQPLRKLILWPTVPFNSPAIEVTERRACLHFERITEPHVKFALVSSPGLASYEAQGQRMRSWVDYDPEAPYPEGGGNVSFYGNADFGEVEHIGPFASLGAGETATLEQRVSIEQCLA